MKAVSSRAWSCGRGALVFLVQVADSGHAKKLNAFIGGVGVEDFKSGQTKMKSALVDFPSNDDDYDVKNWEMLSELDAGEFERLANAEIETRFPEQGRRLLRHYLRVRHRFREESRVGWHGLQPGDVHHDHGGTTIYAKSLIEEFSAKMINNSSTDVCVGGSHGSFSFTDASADYLSVRVMSWFSKKHDPKGTNSGNEHSSQLDGSTLSTVNASVSAVNSLAVTRTNTPPSPTSTTAADADKRPVTLRPYALQCLRPVLQAALRLWGWHLLSCMEFSDRM
ncbi:uncharacterized protein PAC_16432 [Phialocephala subalpina]|uniref:Uncharacterized protein n=1 Tax=Phialocephala subalpina TaxID=576137 RepID=A0A1L7XN91_9HELO|nr:uncharacterized protein PAC_16432 [Phialocephala subalpina]